MAAFKQSIRFHEDGYGHAVIWLLFSDVYADTIDLDGADEVDVFDMDTTAEDMDIDSGVYAADELTFRVLTEAAETADDNAAIAMIEAAEDPANPVYCALVVNPALESAVDDDEVAFRGQVQPRRGFNDTTWGGTEFSSTTAAEKEWSLSAISYDAQLLLDSEIGTLLDDWKEADETAYNAFKAAEVADRLGPFYREDGVDDYGHRELRFANLIHFHTLASKLLELASPAGVTLELDSPIVTNYRVNPARFNSHTVKGRRVRYHYTGYSGEPQAYRTHGTGDSYVLGISDDPDTDGELFVNWRLVRPGKGEEELSWQSLTVAEMLYGVAHVLGLFVSFEYVSHTTIRVKMKTRSSVQGGAVYIKDASESSGDTEPVENPEDQRWRGVVWQNLAEGRKMYLFDGHGFTVGPASRAADKGKALLLTIGPGYCLLPSEDAEDADTNMEGEWALLAHNAVFYNGPNASDRLSGWYHDRAAISTSMYIKCPGLPSNYQGFLDGSVGVQGRSTYMPVAYVTTKHGSKILNSDALDILLNLFHEVDDAAFKTSRTLTIPYLFGFRASPGGASDWRNLQRGSILNLDGIDYIVVGIERAWRALETRVRLHALTRFSFSTPTDAEDPDDGNDTGEFIDEAPSKNVVKKFPAGEDISVDDAVTIRSDGKVYRSRAHEDDYSTVQGLALDWYDPEVSETAMIRVTLSGRHKLSAVTALSPGTRVFVRTVAAPGQNWTHLPLLRRNRSENLFYEIGTIEDESTVVVTHAKQFIFS